LQKLTTITAETAEIAEIHLLNGLTEFCVQRRGVILKVTLRASRSACYAVNWEPCPS